MQHVFKIIHEKQLHRFLFWKKIYYKCCAKKIIGNLLLDHSECQLRKTANNVTSNLVTNIKQCTNEPLLKPNYVIAVSELKDGITMDI